MVVGGGFTYRFSGEEIGIDQGGMHGTYHKYLCVYVGVLM